MSLLSDGALERLRRETAYPDLSGTRYTVVEFIAAGGMGEVYLVHDTMLGRQVAMKVLSAVDASEDLERRMLAEARIVAGLEHPGIVPVHDVGRLADGRVFFTMKFVRGDRLDRFLSDSLTLQDRLRTFLKLCEAVAFAHAHGVLHRDLKPENVMVGPFGEVLVMDWGIAKVLNGAGASLAAAPQAEGVEDRGVEDRGAEDGAQPRSVAAPTDTAVGAVLGTPRYMAPEQAVGTGAPLDRRADVFALGGILHFLLTDRPPKSDATHQERTAALIVGLRRLNAVAPRALAAVCLRSLASSRDDRYGSAEELAADIAAYLDSRPVSAYPESFAEIAWRWIRANKFLLLLIAAYLLMRAIVFLTMGN